MAKQSLSLKAARDFTCLAGDCPAHCCGPWLVKLDKQTIDSWAQIDPSSLSEKFISRIDTLSLGGDSQAVLSKNANGNCANLTADGLCELQQECGHEILPETCQSYPRLQIENSWRTFNSAELSCPEITRLTIESDGGLIVGNRNAKVSHSNEPATKLFRAFDELFLLVLAEKKYPINLRLYYLAWKIRNLLETIEHAGIQSKLLKFSRPLIRSELYGLMLNYRKDAISIDRPKAEKFWSLAIGMLGENTNSELENIRNDALYRQMFSYKDQPEQLYDAISALRNEVADEVSIKYRSMMEKYVPVMFMNRGLPWNPVADNIFATFVHATIPIALVSMTLWLNHRNNHTVDSAFLQKSIYTIERQLKHTTSIYERLNFDQSLLEMNRYPEFYLEIA